MMPFTRFITVRVSWMPKTVVKSSFFFFGHGTPCASGVKQGLTAKYAANPEKWRWKCQVELLTLGVILEHERLILKLPISNP